MMSPSLSLHDIFAGTVRRVLPPHWLLPKDLPEDFDHPDVGDLQDGDGDEEVSRK